MATQNKSTRNESMQFSGGKQRGIDNWRSHIQLKCLPDEWSIKPLMVFWISAISCIEPSIAAAKS